MELETLIGISIMVGFVIVIEIIALIVRNQEKKAYNNGICPVCGEQFICFDHDSEGGRMYRCKNWHFCDVTYNIDKD